MSNPGLVCATFFTSGVVWTIFLKLLMPQGIVMSQYAPGVSYMLCALVTCWIFSLIGTVMALGDIL